MKCGSGTCARPHRWHIAAAVLAVVLATLSGMAHVTTLPSREPAIAEAPAMETHQPEQPNAMAAEGIDFANVFQPLAVGLAGIALVAAMRKRIH